MIPGEFGTPTNAVNSFTYQMVWTSTNALDTGSYTYTVTNGAQMTSDGTLDVIGKGK